MTDITGLKRMLCDQAIEVAARLLPEGRKEGAEWRAGSVSGEKGQSLGVHLCGAKAGVWADFSSGETGDLIDLWMAVRGLKLPEALDEIRSYLGVTRPEPYRDPRPEYIRPAKPKCSTPKARVLDYLREDRNIPREIIDKYRVGEDGNRIVFPFLLPDGTLALAKTREAVDGAKPIPTAANCEAVLFGWQAIEPNQRTVVLTEGECLPGDTEILTPAGWLSLEAYNGGSVAQWDGGCLQWVIPLAKIDKAYFGDLITFRGHLVSITATPGHRMPGISRGGLLRILTAEDRSTGHHKCDSLPRSGKMDGPGIGLTLDQIALCIAISADAAIDRRKMIAGCKTGVAAAQPRYARITVFKNRKVQRLQGLLNRLNIAHSRTNNIKNPRRCDGVFFGVPMPDWVPGRFLPWEWIANATSAEREFIIEELTHWDGNSVPNRNQTEYSSKHLINAEWVQAICHTAGRCSTIIPRKNEFGEWFKVSLLHGKTSGSYQTMKPTRGAHAGRVYCLKVPSGMFLARQNGRIFVTGNCDALSMAAYGFPAMSVPFGGGGKGKQNWIENEFDRLERFESIFIATDMDEQGELAAAEIAARLGRHRCYRVKLPRKDANACLVDGVSQAEIAKCVAEAQGLDPEGLRRASHYGSKMEAMFWPAHEERAGYSMPYSGANGKIMFRPAEVTLWSGATGSGKSVLISDSIPCWIRDGSRVCLASFEMKPEWTLKRMIKQAGGVDRPTIPYLKDILAYLDTGLLLYEKVGKSNVAALLEVFDYARAKYGCDQFVIDSLMRLGIEADDYNAQEQGVFKMVDWAIANNVHLHLVAHSRKGGQDRTVPEAEDIKGAMEIGANAFNIITIWRNRKIEEFGGDIANRPEMTEEPGVTVNIAKQRNGDFEGKVKLFFNVKTYQYHSLSDNRRFPRSYVNPPQQESLTA